MGDGSKLEAAKTRAAIEAALSRMALPGPLGVAVSGGGDSIALLIVADAWARAHARVLRVATVDHGLRAEAAEEAEAVATLAKRLGRAHETLVVTGLNPAGPGNLPAEARRARYGALAGWARRHGLGAVLLGHTLDDQAETVLMRLARGSGAEGLAGMRPVSRRLGITWLRPVLTVRRAALRELLAEAGVGWFEDPSNEDLAQDRIKARRALASLAPLGIEAQGLARTAERLARQARVLRADAARLAHRAVQAMAGGAVLDMDRVATAEEDTRLRLIAACIMAVTGAEYRPRFRALEAAVAAISDPGPRPRPRPRPRSRPRSRPRRATLAGCLLDPVPGADGRASLVICREEAAAPTMRLDPGENVWDNRWRLEVPADAAASGLSVSPLGAAGVTDLGGAGAIRCGSAPSRALVQGLPAIRNRAGEVLAVAVASGPVQTLKLPDLDIICTELVSKRLDRLAFAGE